MIIRRILTLCLVVTSCSEPLTVPGKLIFEAGNMQTAPVGQPVPIRPAVKLTDAYGRPAAGWTVIFSVWSGGGSVTGDSQKTNADGIATVGSWTLGPNPGENTLVVFGPGLPEGTIGKFTATGVIP